MSLFSLGHESVSLARRGVRWMVVVLSMALSHDRPRASSQSFSLSRKVIPDLAGTREGLYFLSFICYFFIFFIFVRR